MGAVEPSTSTVSNAGVAYALLKGSTTAKGTPGRQYVRVPDADDSLSAGPLGPASSAGAGAGVQDESRDGAPAPGTASKRKPLGRRIAGAGVSIGLILVIFLGVIPQFANYSDAWTAIQNMSAGWLVALVIAAAVNQISYVWPYQAVLDHLRYRHGFEETQTASAISNTVPAGGAVAVGMTFRMFGSFGFSNVAISTAVATTGMWTIAFKLGFPIVVTVLVVATGQNAAGAAGVAVAGILVVAVAGLIIWRVFHSDSSAHKVGRMGDKAVNWALRLAHKPKSDQVERAVLSFRDETNDTVHQHGWLLTLAVLIAQTTVLVLVYFCIRSVGITTSQVSFLEAMLSIGIARLVGVIPLTPGGLGTIDAAFIGMLTAMGANSSVALAADMMWRATTYFPPIFIGILTYALWKRGMAKGKYAAAPDAKPPPVLAA